MSEGGRAVRALALAAVAILGSVLVTRAGAAGLAGSRTLACRDARLVLGQLRCGKDSAAAVRAACPGIAMPPPGTSVDAQCRPRPDRGLMRALEVPVDINHASPAALQSLPGVGPFLAARIVASRPFVDVDALQDVKGIGPATLRRIRGRVQTIAHP